MEHIIKLPNDNIRVLVEDEKEIEKRHTISIEGAIIRCIKHILRYSEFTMTKDIMIRIFYLALKGLHCKNHHLSISQRLALYEYFKGKTIDDVYIQQFLKETEELLKT